MVMLILYASCLHTSHTAIAHTRNAVHSMRVQFTERAIKTVMLAQLEAKAFEAKQVGRDPY